MRTSFRTSFWGYKRKQVDEHVRLLIAELESKLREREQVLSQAQMSRDQLRDRAAKIQAEIDSYRNREAAIANTLMQAVAAQQEEVKSAREKSERMRNEAIARVAAKRTEINDLKAQIERFKAELNHLIEQYRPLAASEGSLAARAETNVSPGLRTDAGGSMRVNS